MAALKPQGPPPMMILSIFACKTASFNHQIIISVISYFREVLVLEKFKLFMTFWGFALI